MIIGVPKEIKTGELRVALTPSAVRSLIDAGHDVVIQIGAGEASGFEDEAFREAGATVTSQAEVWMNAGLVVKVKEPLAEEYRLLRPDAALFTFLHLAGVPGLADALSESGVTAVAYETVELDDRTFPLLAPMSEIAGRLATLAGAHYLEHAHGGKGKLIGGVPGTPPSNVAVVGAGIVGQNAARLAMACGAHVALLNRGTERLRQFQAFGYPGNLETAVATPAKVAESVAWADIVIGAVYVGGETAPRVITRDMVRTMEAGSVLVDVSIDQGGCAETSRPTSYADPVYVEEGVIHFCVANIPGAVPRTSSLALANATLPYVRLIADKTVAGAATQSAALARGVNVCRGRITHPAVAKSLGKDFSPLSDLLGP